MNRNPDAEEDSPPQATSSPEQASPSIALVETRITGTDSPAEPEHNVPPSWVPAWAAPAFVWGIWTLMLLTNLTFIGKYADSVPFCEDWCNIVPYLTGENHITIDYLWAQEVEHRYPLPKVILLTLLKLSGGDFRAPHFFKIFAMGGLAFAMIRVASNLRGWTSYTDAFFPIALLHAGFASYTPGAWESTVYLVPAIVAVPILIIAVQKGTQITLGTGMLAGICLALLPLCSAAGLLYLPLLTLWLGYSAVMSWRSPELHGKRDQPGDPGLDLDGFTLSTALFLWI